MYPIRKAFFRLYLAAILSTCLIANAKEKPDNNARSVLTEDKNLPNIKIIAKWNNPLSKRDYRAGVEHHSFLSKANGTEVGYSIYLPPKYYTNDSRYPVQYFLGGKGNDENIQQKRWAHHLDPAIEWGNLPPLIIVWPNPMKNSWYMDSKNIKVETMIVKELIQHVDATYKTYSDRKHRWIAGMSMGGTGCLKFAFKYPSLFSSVVSYAPAVSMNTERWPVNPRKFVEADIDRAKTVRVRIVCGDKDRLYKGAMEFHTFLSKLGVPCEFETLSGIGHNMNEIFDQVGIKGFLFHIESVEK